MDKNKFCLGGRLFNTTSPRLVSPTQRKERPQDVAPKRNTRHVRKLLPNEKGNENVHRREPNELEQRKARPQVGCPNAHPQCKRKARPQRKTRPHVRKLGAATQRKALPQDGRPNAKLIRNENVHTREH
jgi:hypothetical protein